MLIALRKPHQEWALGSTCTMAYRAAEATMIAAPLGVNASVVTPVLSRLHFCVSVLFTAVPCTAAWHDSSAD